MNSTSQSITLEASTSLWQDSWRRLLRNRMAVASMALLVMLVGMAFLGMWWTPYPIDQVHYDAIGRAPSFAHLFGTDSLGRDQFSRCMFGLRMSLMVGVLAAMVSVLIGVLWGSISGYVGGKVDNAMMRFVDVLYGLPHMFFIIIVMMVLGRNIAVMFMAIAAFSWLTMSRIVRGQMLSLRHKEFVEAARASGSTHATILFRHLIPNALGPIIVYATLTVPNMILLEAFLSFLGLGIQAPLASLGTLVSDGAQAMEIYPWMLLFPGALLALLLFALNFLGDGLRDALDPRMK